MSVVSKTFKHLFDLPPELRIMVVDEMAPDDRWRFSGCSILCNKIAKSSKYYIYELKINGESENYIELRVRVNEYSSNNGKLGFVVKFRREQGTQFVECVSLHVQKRFWITQLDNSINLAEYATEHVKNILQFYQRTIRSLHIYGALFRSFIKKSDFGIECFSNLENLYIDDEIYVEQFLSKTRKPLAYLEVAGELCNETIENCQKFYQIREELYMGKSLLTNEQLPQFPALHVAISIAEYTELDIFNFIRRWQNGEEWKRRGSYGWAIPPDSNFDWKKLFAFFGSYRDEDNMIYLQKFNEARYVHLDYDRHHKQITFDFN